MSDSVYSVIAYIARYWFLFLGIIILWRAIMWMRKDNDRVNRVQRRLPDAGFIGEWAVVASDAPGIPPGKVLRAPRDGWIGSARGCDIRLRRAGVPAKAARFILRDDGLYVQPQRRGILLVDGEAVNREAVLRHGATLTVGGVTLQLRLFAGVLLDGEEPAIANYRGRRSRRRQQPEPEPIYDAYEEEDVDDEPEEAYDAYDEDGEYSEYDEYDEDGDGYYDA